MDSLQQRIDVDLSNDKNEGYVKYKIDQELAAQKKVRTIRIQGNQAQNLVRQIHSLYRSRIKHLLYVKDQKDDIIVSFYDSIRLSQLIPLFEQFSGIQIKQCHLNKVRDATPFNLLISDSESDNSISSSLSSSSSSISQNNKNKFQFEEISDQLCVAADSSFFTSYETDSSDNTSRKRHSFIKKMTPLKQKKRKQPDQEELFDKKASFFNLIELVAKKNDFISIKDVFQYLQCMPQGRDESLSMMLLLANKECQKAVQGLLDLKKIVSNEENSSNFKNSAITFSSNGNKNNLIDIALSNNIGCVSPFSNSPPIFNSDNTLLSNHIIAPDQQNLSSTNNDISHLPACDNTKDNIQIPPLFSFVTQDSPSSLLTTNSSDNSLITLKVSQSNEDERDNTPNYQQESQSSSECTSSLLNNYPTLSQPTPERINNFNCQKIKTSTSLSPNKSVNHISYHKTNQNMHNKHHGTYIRPKR